MKYTALFLTVCAFSLLSGCSKDQSTSAPPIDSYVEPEAELGGSLPPPDSSDASVAQQEPLPEPSEIEDTLPTAQQEYPEPEFTVTANQLLAEYEADKTAWRKKYNYRAVELSGTVSGYSSSYIQGHSGFEIQVQGESESFGITVQEETPWVNYLPGSSIVVRGKAKSAGGIEVEDALVVSSKEGEPLPKFTTKSLLESTEADALPDTPGLRRGDWMLLEGIVAERDAEYDDNGVLYLGAEGRREVAVWTARDGNYDSRQCRSLKPEDNVVFLCRYRMRDEGLRVVTPAFLMSPLPGLPKLPVKALLPNADGLPFPHLVFTADLLGQWQSADPRALERMVERNSRFAQTDLTGEIRAIEPSEYDEGHVFLFLKNASGATVKCLIEQRDAERLKLEVGTSINARGALFVELDYAWMNEPEVYVH